MDGLVTLEAGGRSNAKETEAKPIFREEEREQSYRDPIVGTRPSANSGHNARNFCKNGVTTIFQVAIWTICELLVQPRKGFE